MQASYIIVRIGFSMNLFIILWFKCMIIACPGYLGQSAQSDCPGYPGQSAQSDAMLEDSMMSVKTLYSPGGVSH